LSFLGIDLGTSGLRAMLMDEAGLAIRTVEADYTTRSPAPGWSEQDPKLWIDALDAVVEELRITEPRFANLIGIGVAGHMHGATLLDDMGNVLRPCILWNDTRAATEAAAIDQNPVFRDISGNIVFPGFTAPKLAWVAKHEPEIFRKTAKVLLPAAYLNYHLTGDYVADFSDSAGTSWLDINARDWSNTLLSIGGVDVSQMPNLVEGCDAAGMLRQDLKRKWGLKQDVVIAGGAGDNAAAACGIGAFKEGQGFVSLGTSGVILIARDGCYPAPATAVHTFCHALPARWYQMGVMLSATDSLNWLSKITGQTPAQLTRALPDALRTPSAVKFMPYLSGERTPHNDAKVRGGFLNVSIQNDAVDLTQSVLEGVAFGLRDSLEALRQTGALPKALYAIGGGAKSDYWLKLLATVLQIELQVPEDGDFGPALGAARLAQIASCGSDYNTVMRSPTVSRVVKPDTNLIDAFERAYQNFKQNFAAYRSLSC
jgi:xylulokinase